MAVLEPEWLTRITEKSESERLFSNVIVEPLPLLWRPESGHGGDAISRTGTYPSRKGHSYKGGHLPGIEGRARLWHRTNCPKVATPLELARYQAKREAGDGGTRLTQAARTDCPRHLDRAEHIGGADAQAGGPLPSSSPPKESVPSATTRASLLPLAPSNRRVHAERQGCSEGSTTKCSDCAKQLR